MSSELDELRVRYERLQALHHVSEVIHSSLDPQQALQLILSEAVRLMRASSGSIVLVNPTTQRLEIEAAFGLPEDARELRLRVGEGITGWVVRFGKPARTGNAEADPRYVRLRDHVRSELAVPLAVDNEIRGVLNVDSDRTNAFSESDEGLLQDLAQQAARVIHNTWLYEQLRLKAKLFEALTRVAQTINSALHVQEALRVIVREASGLIDAKLCSLLLLDETKQWLDLGACHGAGPDYANKPRLSASESFVGVVVRRKKPLQLENVRTSALYQNVDAASREGLCALLSVPLIFQGDAIGALCVYTGYPHSFSNEEIRTFSAVADLSAIAIEKARLHERIVGMEDHLRQNEKLSALGLLAAEVAHEIRNPLTVLKMLFHSLDLRYPPHDPRTRDVQIIGEKMDHLNRIVEQVLDFARSAEPRFAEVDVNQLIDDLALLTRHKLSHHAIELICRLTPDSPRITVDPAQMSQAFLNLTLNALEAMPSGGRLTLSTELIQPPNEGTQLLIHFQDTGHGMTPLQCERIFTSILNTNKARGTGLGLAIVKKVMELHRGGVSAQSELGHGTRVTLRLPLDATNAPLPAP